MNGRDRAQFILSELEPDSITWARTPEPNPDSHWTRRLLRSEVPAETTSEQTVIEGSSVKQKKTRWFNFEFYTSKALACMWLFEIKGIFFSLQLYEK